MAKTLSTMLPLGTRAPEFSLPDVATGKNISLDNFKDMKLLLVIFISRHCPYVRHIKGELAKLGRDYKEKDIGIVAITANDLATHPDDSPGNMKALAKAEGFVFPICFDETQETAKAYSAACTPDFFLFDRERKLIYRGQLDESRPSNQISVTGQDLREAIEAGLSDKPVPNDQKPSLGCNIKWKTGNEPAYFNAGQ